MVLNVKVKMLTSNSAENHETNRYNIKTKTCVSAPGCCCCCSRISDVTFGPFPVSERFQKRAIQHPNVICLFQGRRQGQPLNSARRLPTSALTNALRASQSD